MIKVAHKSKDNCILRHRYAKHMYSFIASKHAITKSRTSQSSESGAGGGGACLCVYMYVCMSVYVYVCVCVCVCVCVREREREIERKKDRERKSIYTSTYTDKYISLLVCIQVYMYRCT